MFASCDDQTTIYKSRLKNSFFFFLGGDGAQLNTLNGSADLSVHLTVENECMNLVSS